MYRTHRCSVHVAFCMSIYGYGTITDTYSFIFQIFCEDLDKELPKMTDSFDLLTKIITHFVEIRSKEYAFKFLDGKEEKRGSQR